MTNDPATASISSHSVPLLRVTVLVTRDHPVQPHLLVFSRDDGLQRLPDRLVEPQQTPAEAARLLLKQLFGPDSVVSEHRIAVVRERLDAGNYVLLQRRPLRTGPDDTAAVLRFALERGARVRVLEAQSGFVRVAHDEFVYHDARLHIRTRRAGWLEANALTTVVDHHLFHACSPRASAPVVAQTAWIVLSATHRLLPAHRRWVERARQRVREARC